MDEAEVRAFLSELPARTAKLATVRADGRPHLAPVWFDLDDDGSLMFNTSQNSVKGRNLLRDDRVSMCIDDDHPPFSFVMIEGTAEVSRDLATVREWATRIGGRYMGADRAEEYGARNGVPDELLVRVRPGLVRAVADLAD